MSAVVGGQAGGEHHSQIICGFNLRVNAKLITKSAANRTCKLVDIKFIPHYHLLPMTLLSRLPLVALLFALAVFTLTMILAVTAGTGLSKPFNLVLVVLLAATVVLMFLAQNPNNDNAALFFWFAAGVWGASAYLNFQSVGMGQLLVALLSAGSAFWIERESRAYSFAGPALFIGTGLALVIISNMLGQV